MSDLVIDIVDMFGEGYTVDEIANELGIPRDWVKFTVSTFTKCLCESGVLQ